MHWVSASRSVVMSPTLPARPGSLAYADRATFGQRQGFSPHRQRRDQPPTSLHTGSLQPASASTRRRTPRITCRRRRAKPAVAGQVHADVRGAPNDRMLRRELDGGIAVDAFLGSWQSTDDLVRPRALDCGIVRCNVFAVRMLSTKSNLCGRWIGRSPGFVPLSIRSTYSLGRLHMSTTFGP